MKENPKVIPLSKRLKNATSALLGGTRFGKAFDALTNRYEAAYSSPRRPYISSPLLDARFDITGWTRWEITRKIQYFEQNTWIVPAIRKTHVKYTAANGLPIVPASSDHEWNARMIERYNEWSESPFVDSTISLADGWRIVSGADCVTGESFILKTKKKSKAGKTEPAIQLIEGFRCSSATSFQGGMDVAKNVIDGVEINRAGRPVGYWIRDNITDTYSGDTWSYKSADNVIHVFNPGRPGQYRGLSDFAAILNQLQDLITLTGLEMDKAKANAAIANIWETWTGEASPQGGATGNAFASMMAGASGGNLSPELNPDFLKRLAEFRQVLGASTVYTKPGEKISQLTNENPSAATQWYWRFLIAQIFAAKDLPLILALPESVQGTVARGVLDDANIAFRMDFRRYARASVGVYRYFADWARYNDPELWDAPADWWKCHVVPPKRVNVDEGRNAAATLSMLDAGAISYDEIADEDGTTADVRFRRKARNIGRIKQIALEESTSMGVEIKPEEIAAPLNEILKTFQPAGTAPVQEEELIPA